MKPGGWPCMSPSGRLFFATQSKHTVPKASATVHCPLSGRETRLLPLEDSGQLTMDSGQWREFFSARPGLIRGWIDLVFGSYRCCSTSRGSPVRWSWIWKRRNS